MQPKKALGQHWLDDSAMLAAIADEISFEPGSHVLEVGPGPGTLTDVLLERGANVTAVELDDHWAEQLEARLGGESLRVFKSDILSFDTTEMPADYSVIANIPYYLTAKLIRSMLESPNPPQAMALLVQKEVAERLAAEPGSHSMLSIMAQYYCDVRLGVIIGPEYFTPPPKVDSQVVVLERLAQPRSSIEAKAFFRVVKAGFSERRKKLANALSGGLQIPLEEARALVQSAGLADTVRAQELSFTEWEQVFNAYSN